VRWSEKKEKPRKKGHYGTILRKSRKKKNAPRLMLDPGEKCEECSNFCCGGSSYVAAASAKISSAGNPNEGDADIARRSSLALTPTRPAGRDKPEKRWIPIGQNTKPQLEEEKNLANCIRGKKSTEKKKDTKRNASFQGKGSNCRKVNRPGGNTLRKACQDLKGKAYRGLASGSKNAGQAREGGNERGGGCGKRRGVRHIYNGTGGSQHSNESLTRRPWSMETRL